MSCKNCISSYPFVPGAHGDGTSSAALNCLKGIIEQKKFMVPDDVSSNFILSFWLMCG